MTCDLGFDRYPQDLSYLAVLFRLKVLLRGETSAARFAATHDQIIPMTESALPTNSLGNATQDNVQSTHPASDYPLCMM